MPHKEIRKIIRVGDSFAVTLPKGWLKYFGIEPGDEIEMVSNKNITIKRVEK